MKYILIFLSIIFLLPLANADSTFFDNQDDAFIMGTTTTTGTIGGVIGGTTGGGSTSGSCRDDWNCTMWSKCLSSGNQSRTCTNIGTCSDVDNAPETEQSCAYSISKFKEPSEKSAA